MTPELERWLMAEGMRRLAENLEAGRAICRWLERDYKPRQGSGSFVVPIKPKGAK